MSATSAAPRAVGDPRARIEAAAATTRRLVDLLLRVDPEPAGAAGPGADELTEVGRLLAEAESRLRAAAAEPRQVIERERTIPPEDVYDALTGRANAAAPPLDFVIQPDLSVRADFTLGLAQQGPVGIAHGGISAMVLDHALGVSTEAIGRRSYTATLSLEYLRPVPLLVPLQVRTRCTRTERRKSWANGEILHDGEVCVRGEGLFVVL